MKRVVEFVRAASAIFAFAALGFAATEAGLFLRESCDQVQHVATVTLPAVDTAIRSVNDDAVVVGGQVASISRNLDRRISETSQNLNAILIQAGLAADQLQEASREQKAYWQSISVDTDRLLKSFEGGAAQFDANMRDLNFILHSTQLTDALVQTDGVLADAHEITTDAKGVVKRYSKPETRKQKIINDAKQIGGLTYLVVKIVASLP